MALNQSLLKRCQLSEKKPGFIPPSRYQHQISRPQGKDCPIRLPWPSRQLRDPQLRGGGRSVGCASSQPGNALSTASFNIDSPVTSKNHRSLREMAVVIGYPTCTPACFKYSSLAPPLNPPTAITLAALKHHTHLTIHFSLLKPGTDINTRRNQTKTSSRTLTITYKHDVRSIKTRPVFQRTARRPSTWKLSWVGRRSVCTRAISHM